MRGKGLFGLLERSLIGLSCCGVDRRLKAVESRQTSSQGPRETLRPSTRPGQHLDVSLE
jgi:hypothetical protein